MKRLMAAAVLAATGLAAGGAYSASAATTTGSCVGVVTSWNNSFYPGTGGANNKDYIQWLHENGMNFGQSVASHSIGCVN
jgi:hypothetical protein